MTTETEKPPYLTNPAQLELQDLVDACEVMRVDPALMDFVVRQYRLLRKHRGGRLPLAAMAQEEDVNPSTIRRKLKQLTDAGILVEHRKRMEVTPGVNRTALLFEFNNPDAEAIKRQREKQKEAAMRLVERDNVTVVTEQELTTQLASNDDISMYVNMIWSLLFPVLSYSRRDQSEMRSLVIDTEFNERVPVTATSQHGTPIARVTDLVCWTALLSICLDDLRERRIRGIPISNKFTIKGSDIARKLKISRTEYLCQVMERLNNTQINLSRVPEKIMRKWQLDEVVLKTSFIHELVFARIRNMGHLEGGKENPGAWVFQWQLPHYVYDMLIAKLKGKHVTLISISPDLLEERNNVLSGLHLYCRRALPKIDSYETISLNELYQRVAPAMARHEFFENLGEGIKALYNRELKTLESSVPLRVKTTEEMEVVPYEPIEPTGIGEHPLSKHLPTLANVECYGFELIINGEEVQICRNANDPTVGIISEKERQALKRPNSPQQMSMLPEDPEDVDLSF